MLKLKAKRVEMGVKVESKGHVDMTEAVGILLQAVSILKETFDLDTREIIKVDYEWSFLENKYYENSTYRIGDLINNGLVGGVEE